jgi:hypothetical protein
VRVEMNRTSTVVAGRRDAFDQKISSLDGELARLWAQNEATMLGMGNRLETLVGESL